MSRARRQLRAGQQPPPRRTVLNRVMLTLEIENGEEGIGIHAGGTSLQRLHQMLVSALQIVEQEQSKGRIVLPAGIPAEAVQKIQEFEQASA